MSQHWSWFIDQTLNSTNETIRRLKERQAHYNAAKKRVREAFGNYQYPLSATAPCAKETYRNDVSLPRREERLSGASARVATEYNNGVEVKVPPPLPPSVIDYTLSREEDYTRLPLGGGGVRQPLHASLPRGSLELRELTDAYYIVEARLKSVTAELELERTIRKDRERELSDLFSYQIGEIKACVNQLKMENDHLKDSMQALEARQVLSNEVPYTSAGGLHPLQDGAVHSESALGMSQKLKGLKSQMSSGGANQTYGPQVDASGYSAVATSDPLTPWSLNALSQRVAELETSVQHQRRTSDDRQQRINSTIHEAVDNKIKLEVERVRSIAREAACASTENLIQLRFHALQSLFQEELHKVLETTGVTRELSQANERMFHKWEQSWSIKWKGMEDRMHDVEVFTKTVRESLSTDLEKSFKGAFDAVRQELGTLRRETQEGKERLVQECDAKIESSRLEALSTAQSMLSEQQQRDSLIREAAVRRLIESTTQPLHAGLESAQRGLQSVRESNEAWLKQVVPRLEELEGVTQTQKLDIEEVQRALATQPAIMERIRTQLRECTQKQQQLDAAFQELHAATTESIDAARVQAVQHAEQRAQIDANLRRVQQAQEGQSKRLQAIEATQGEHRQRLEQATETIDTLEAALSRSLQPTTQKLNNLQQMVYQNCLPQIESLQQEMLEATARWQHLQDGRSYHEKLVGQLLADAKKDSEARMQDLESHVRQDLEETRLRWKDSMEKHTAALTPIARSVETLETKMSLSEKTQNKMSESVQRLEASLAVLEASVPSSADTRDAVAQATDTLLSKKVESLEAALRAREADEQKSLNTRFERVDEEQLRLGQNLSALQEQFYDAVGKIKHEARLQDAVLKEYAMAAVTKSEDRTLEHVDSAVQSNLERLKELILPSRLVQRVVMEPSELALLGRSLLPHLGLSEEALAAVVGFSEALHGLGQQQADLRRRLVALEEAPREAEEGALWLSPDKGGGAALLRGLQDETQRLQAQLLQHRTAAEEGAAGLAGKVAALEAQAAGGADALQPLRAGLRRLEEAWAGLAEGNWGPHAWEEQATRLVRLEGLVVTRLEEVYRDMVECHQNQLMVLEQRLAQRTVEDSARWKAFQDDMQQQIGKVSESNASATDSRQVGKNRSADDCTKAKFGEDRTTRDSIELHNDNDMHARIEVLEKALAALEQQLGGVSTSSEVGLKATADVLAGLRDSLQQCVSCVTQELRNDSLMLRIVGSGEASASTTVSDQSNANGNDEATLQKLPKIKALDQVFLLFMRQLRYVCHGLATLQENAFATLELVQQQEMSILAIPTLQEALLLITSQLRKVGMALPELGEWDVSIEQMVQSTMLRPQDTVSEEQ